jgi:hypothetical protein
MTDKLRTEINNNLDELVIDSHNIGCKKGWEDCCDELETTIIVAWEYRTDTHIRGRNILKKR